MALQNLHAKMLFSADLVVTLVYAKEPVPQKDLALDEDMSGFKELVVKNLPAMQETPVQFLGQEDTLEKG